MTNLAIGIAWALLVLASIQVAVVLGFAWLLWRHRGPAPGAPSDAWAPEATVVLCLRGGDPFLPDCIRAMLTQDYPSYRAKIIVDSRDDPAWRVAHAVVEELGAANVEIEALENPRPTCSLKCSSLLQAVDGLDPSCQVIALVDADTIAHPTWLSELVAPLRDEQVGAATGNRWYMPERPSWGAMVRYVWNAAAIVQMYWGQIAWGGTLAVKVSVLRETDLLDRWGAAFCEDTMLKRQLGGHGLKTAFVPSLMMVNRENCTLGGFFRWVRRQLLTARLYHPAWPLTLSHGISTSVVPAAALVAATAAAVKSDWIAARIAAGSFVLYEIAMVLVLLPLECAVRAVVRRRGQPTRWMSFKTGLLYVAALPLTQLLYPAALVSSIFMKRVDWRGVSYQVDAPHQVRLLEYRPFEPSDDETESL